MKNGKKTLAALLAGALAAAIAIPGAAQGQAGSGIPVRYGESDHLHVSLIGHYASGAEADEGGTEIVAYDPESRTMFSVNGAEKALDIISLDGLKGDGASVQALELTKRVGLGDIHEQLTAISDITSVAMSPTEDYIAISVPAEPKTDPGYVVFMGIDGTYLSHVQVGSLPDMVTFTPDGRTVLVANEGEPDDAYENNPEGSVAIIDVSGPVSDVSEDDVAIARLTDSVVGDDVRLVHEDFTKAQNMEPEYIVVSSDSKTAYVALQENNSIAILDLASKSFSDVKFLGYKDWSANGNVLDASDKDGIVDIRHWPVLGMYMPDGLSLYEAGGKTYLLTANEGDAADYDGFSEEARVEDLADRYDLNADLYSGYDQAELDAMVEDGLFEETQLGRLKTTVSAPTNDEGKYEAIYGFGARSFTIWDAADMSVVYDSGGEFETLHAKAAPEWFNSDNTENNFDDRSDDKGPEPETVTTGTVGSKTFAFVGLERNGGIAAYDVTNPQSPRLATYFSTREFGSGELAGDSAPEGLTFVAAEDSPTGKALLLAAHEVSGTIAVFELSDALPAGAEQQGTAITIMHVNDVHSRVESGIGYAKLATMLKELRDANPNTLFLDAGDSLHGQTIATLVRGESIVEILNEMGLDAMTAGNHDFNYGTDRLLELADMARFPILGANVVKQDGSNALESYVIKEFEGVRVGIFGLSTPETAYKTHPNNVKGITFADPVRTAQAQVDALEGQVDVIVALAHLGTDASSVDTSAKVAEQVDGIDVIVDGHSHEQVNRMIGDTLLVQTGEYSENVGIVELIVHEDGTIDKSAKLIPQEATADIVPDPAVQAVIDGLKAEQETVLGEVVGKTSAALDGERETVRAKESNLGNLIADAMLEATGADIALTNGGGIRASIDAGEVTKGEIITVLPFGNYVVTLDATGAEILQALQHGAGDYPEAKGAFPQVGGISFKIDASKPKGQKVHSVTVNGQPLDPNRTYVLATNDFIAAGGDEYAMFADNPVTGHYPALDEAVIAYMELIGEVSPKTEGRIAEQAAPGAPQQPAPSTDGVYIVKPGDSLSRIGRLYGIRWQELAEANKLGNPHLIYPNQRILIPAQ